MPMRKKILVWIVVISLMALLVLAPDLFSPKELTGQDKTICQSTREEYYAKYEFTETAFTAKDMVVLEKYKADMAAKLGISDPDNYVFDMWSCAFFTKEEARQGKILEYRKLMGLK